jgi:hypothetical protein
MEIKVLNGQSIFDVAIQAAGSAEAAMEIAALNGISITDDLAAGTVLKVSATLSKQIADYYRTNGIRPATGLSAADADRVESYAPYLEVSQTVIFLTEESPCADIDVYSNVKWMVR